MQDGTCKNLRKSQGLYFVAQKSAKAGLNASEVQI